MNSQPSAIPSMRAAIYGRVSTNQQTIETQEARAKQYLEFKRLEPCAEFYDPDVSGSIPIWLREDGKKLKERLQRGDIKHLVVATLDRLGRSAVDILNTMQFLDSLGVVLHIVDLNGDSLSTQGAAGRLMLTILAGMAQFERDLIRGRINSKLRLKRDRGELIGTVPYGWTATPTGATTPKGVPVREMVPNPDEQRWILFMQRLRNAGRGYHTIAKELNRLNAPTKRGKGVAMELRHAGHPDGTITKLTTGKWQAGNVAKVLNNKTVQAWLVGRDLAAAA
jgi:DNA invertase Pin-like site-specific DNA recombinase